MQVSWVLPEVSGGPLWDIESWTRRVFNLILPEPWQDSYVLMVPKFNPFRAPSGHNCATEWLSWVSPDFMGSLKIQDGAANKRKLQGTSCGNSSCESATAPLGSMMHSLGNTGVGRRLQKEGHEGVAKEVMREWWKRRTWRDFGKFIWAEGRKERGGI